MFKNVATKIALFAFDTSTNAAKTGDAANLTAYLSKDYGAVTVLGDTSATEMDATNAKGWYLFDVTQTESNADACLFTAKSSTANISVVGQMIFTTPASFTSFVTPTGATMVIDQTTVLTTTPVANSVGEALFLADNLGGRFGTAQAGGASTITLDAGASAVDGRYVGYAVFLYGGTGGGVRGVGQERTITAYNGTTKVATLAQAWGTNPDNTSKFMLIVHPFANVGIWNGTVVATPATAGIPDVNAKNWNNLTTVALPLIPTVAGRTLDVSATGEAGLDWANVGSPTTALALTGTTIAVTQKVDVDTIKTNPVVNGGTITLPTNATLASTTNITAGTIATVTTVTGLTASDVGAIKTQTDKLAFTVANQVDANIQYVNDVQIQGTGAVGSDEWRKV